MYLAILNSGDEVLVPSPYWVSYPEQIQVAGGRIVPVAATVESNFKVTIDQLDAAKTETKAIVINFIKSDGYSVYKRRVNQYFKLGRSA